MSIQQINNPTFKASDGSIHQNLRVAQDTEARLAFESIFDDDCTAVNSRVFAGSWRTVFQRLLEINNSCPPDDKGKAPYSPAPLDPIDRVQDQGYNEDARPFADDKRGL